jgi:hypothetical protein
MGGGVKRGEVEIRGNKREKGRREEDINEKE